MELHAYPSQLEIHRKAKVLLSWWFNPPSHSSFGLSCYRSSSPSFIRTQHWLSMETLPTVIFTSEPDEARRNQGNVVIPGDLYHADTTQSFGSRRV